MGLSSPSKEACNEVDVMALARLVFWIVVSFIGGPNLMTLISGLQYRKVLPNAQDVDHFVYTVIFFHPLVRIFFVSVFACFHIFSAQLLSCHWEKIVTARFISWRAVSSSTLAELCPQRR